MITRGVSRIVAAAAVAGGCGSSVPAVGQVAPVAPPSPLRLEWADAPGNENPGPEDRALALYPADEWGRVLPCPRDLDDLQPADPDRHRCAFPHVGALGLAGATVWTAAAIDSHEHDGMYGQEQGVVVVDPGPPVRVIATLIQWDEDVVDCRTTLLQRRQRAIDLDGDGAAELCVESVSEAGVGLFEVMDQGDRHERWRPNRRRRQIHAFGYDPVRARLDRRPALDAGCPDRGYAPFVPGVPVVADPIAWRRDVEGDDAVAACPTGPVNSCFDVCDAP